MKELMKKIDDVLAKALDEVEKISDKAIKEEKNDAAQKNIKLVSLYYKAVILGAKNYGKNIYNMTQDMKLVINEELDEESLNKYYEPETKLSSLKNIELEYNPVLNIQVDQVLDDNDIELDENPPLNIKVEDLITPEDIVLDENPPIDLEVEDVLGDNDLELDFNPKISTKVDALSEEESELLGSLKIAVDEVADDFSFSAKDFDKKLRDKRRAKIELDENPDLKLEVEEVKEEYDKNNKSNILGDLTIDVEEVKDNFAFDAKEFDKKLSEIRKKKNARSIELDENPTIKLEVEEVK